MWTFLNARVDQQGTWSFGTTFCLFGELLVPKVTSLLLIKLHPLKFNLHQIPLQGVLGWCLESRMLNEMSFVCRHGLLMGSGRAFSVTLVGLHSNANYNETPITMRSKNTLDPTGSQMPAKAVSKCFLFSEGSKSRIMGSIRLKAGYWVCSRLYHFPRVSQAKPDRGT